MDVKYVTTVTSTDSTGKPVEAIPVRAWATGETDNAGKPVAAVPITINANGAPVRLVAGKMAQNSVGQWLDTMPNSGQGAYSLPTPILIEGYDGPIGNYTVSQGTGSIDTVNKVQGTGSHGLKGRGASETPQANKTIASMDPNDFGTIAVWFRQNREGARNNGVRYQIGRASGSYQDALVSTAPAMPMGYWGAVHVSELLAFSPSAWVPRCQAAHVPECPLRHGRQYRLRRSTGQGTRQGFVPLRRHPRHHQNDVRASDAGFGLAGVLPDCPEWRCGDWGPQSSVDRSNAGTRSHVRVRNVLRQLGR
jgi:hypothetical protein